MNELATTVNHQVRLARRPVGLPVGDDWRMTAEPVGEPEAGGVVVRTLAAKCDWVVRELGFDACIDYKAGSVKDGLKAHCPRGVDVYFDNVGGDILDAVLTRIGRHARIVVCGAISQYNSTEAVKGPSNYLSLLVNRARMEGMVVFDYADRFPQAIAELAGYLKDGKLRSREDVVEGLQSFPETLLRLFRGENFGKLVLQVAKDGASSNHGAAGDD